MTQINPIQKKIPDTSRLVKKQTILLKLLKEIESEIPSDRGLAKTSALTVVVNKIPNISNLVKKRIMIQKYLILNLNILLQLIIINLLKILFITA